MDSIELPQVEEWITRPSTASKERTTRRGLAAGTVSNFANPNLSPMTSQEAKLVEDSAKTNELLEPDG